HFLRLFGREPQGPQKLLLRRRALRFEEGAKPKDSAVILSAEMGMIVFVFGIGLRIFFSRTVISSCNENSVFSLISRSTSKGSITTSTPFVSCCVRCVVFSSLSVNLCYR